MTDFITTLFSVGMFSGASAVFIGSITATSYFWIFLFLFLFSIFGLVAYHSLLYFSCKLAEKFNLVEK
jgi:hypothetical protein